jgi:protein-S-isoprenylcysteine O-methyltransferase Ste14
MKKELFEYASNTLPYKQPEKTDISLFFSNKAWTICVSFFMIVLSIPLLISKLWLWIVLFTLWILMLLYRRKEEKQYMRSILIDGMFLIYIACFASYISVKFLNLKTERSCLLPLIVITGFYLTVYELVFLIKIIQKKYSNNNQDIESQNDKNKNQTLISVLSSVGVFLGIISYKLFGKSIPYSIHQIMLVAFVGSLWLGGFILIQKFFILKILKFK